MSTHCYSKVSLVPYEIWHEILRLCSVEDVLKLERTCHFFLMLISSQYFWFRRLQDLDQLHAPDLPPNVSVSSLTYQELRSLVVRARKRVLNFTGSSPLRVSKEFVISLDQASTKGVLGEPSAWGADTLLLPSARYFLMKWPAGYLQCWDVAESVCLWTYPDLPADTFEAQPATAICSFACDVQSNGDVHVAVVTEVSDENERTLAILHFSPERSLSVLFEAKPAAIDIFHGLPIVLKLSGDVSIVYTEGNVTVVFWRENRLVRITKAIIDALEFVDDYIIGVTSSYEGNALVAIPLKLLHELRTEQVDMGEVVVSSCQLTPHPGWLVGRAQLSVCTFHWQEESTRENVMITVLGDVYDEQNWCDFPIADFFSFGLDDAASSNTHSHPIFRSLGRSRLLTFDARLGTYSVMTPPSQAGSTVLAFHDDRSHEPQFSRTIATFTPGKEVVIRVIDGTVVESKPATYSLNVEFYSGAIHYVTKDLQNVVIRFLD